MEESKKSQDKYCLIVKNSMFVNLSLTIRCGPSLRSGPNLIVLVKGLPTYTWHTQIITLLYKYGVQRMSKQTEDYGSDTKIRQKHNYI